MRETVGASVTVGSCVRWKDDLNFITCTDQLLVFETMLDRIECLYCLLQNLFSSDQPHNVILRRNHLYCLRRGLGNVIDRMTCQTLIARLITRRLTLAFPMPDIHPRSMHLAQP